ncbi:hypothetical protein RND71_007811 [Anisodus tanguticus]|uniref:Uncharacterized protein n=1 Tax=Anisodus tanguticus TaxID=243964 RepID=A0AAE1VKF8_9SOLA|nr:hypothetical protein RND71_007811 [Anisodus tanguticus]
MVPTKRKSQNSTTKSSRDSKRIKLQTSLDELVEQVRVISETTYFSCWKKSKDLLK